MSSYNISHVVLDNPVLNGSYFVNLGPKALDFIFNVLIAFVFAIVCHFLIKLVLWFIRRGLEKKKTPVDPTIVTFVLALAKVAMWFVVLPMIVSQIGLDSNSVTAFVGLFGLSLGMATTNVVKSIAAGVLILLTSPFKIGHFIEAGGKSGTVRAMEFFATVLTERDGKMVIMPNAQVIEKEIVNYTLAERLRLDVKVCIAYENDMPACKRLLVKLINNHKQILREPRPKVVVCDLGDDGVILMLRFWVAVKDYWTASFSVKEDIKSTLDRFGFTMPTKQLTVYRADLKPPGETLPVSDEDEEDDHSEASVSTASTSEVRVGVQSQRSGTQMKKGYVVIDDE